MRSKSGNRWIFAVLLVVVFPALAVHVSCVAVMGPGSWGSGMEEKAPRWLPAGSDSVVGPYIREFAERDTAVPTTLPASVAVPGRPFWTDYVASEDLGIVATHEGTSWIEKQRFYVWFRDPEGRPESQAGEGGPRPEAGVSSTEDQTAAPEHAAADRYQIRELDLPSGMILERPALMARGGALYVVVGRWLPWAISPLEKLSRYLKSYRDPTLRPERSLYVYRLPLGPLEYWGPGHTLEPSPDRRVALLLRSGALAAGYYSLHLWDFEQDSLTTIVSLRDADPDSGRSFDYEWSGDSRAVHITGATGGFQRRSGTPRSLDLIWLVGDEGFYDLEAAEETPRGLSVPPGSR